MTGTAAAESVLGRVAKSHAFTEFVFTILLVKEIPTYSKSEYPSIDRVVRCQEIISVSLSGVDVTHHDKETGMLDEHVGICVDDRVVAHFHVVFSVASYGVLSEVRRIVRCCVTGEVTSVRSQVNVEYLSHLELDVEIGVDVQVRHWYHLLLAGVLVGDDVLPSEDSKLEILHQLCGEEVYWA